MNLCIIAWSSARVGRRDAVVPSRRMTGPDSRLPDAGGGWNNGRICFMLGHPLDLLTLNISHSGFTIMTALNPTITTPLISLSHRPSRS